MGLERISTLRQTSPKGNEEMDTGTARATWRKGNLTDIVEPRTLRRCRGSLVVLSLSTRNRKVEKIEIMTEDVALRHRTLANVESSETAFAGGGDECAFRLVHPANCCLPGPDPIEAASRFTLAVAVGQCYAGSDRSGWSEAKHNSEAASLVGGLGARLSVSVSLSVFLRTVPRSECVAAEVAKWGSLRLMGTTRPRFGWSAVGAGLDESAQAPNRSHGLSCLFLARRADKEPRGNAHSACIQREDIGRAWQSRQ